MTFTDPLDCPLYLISRASLVVAWGLRRSLAATGIEQVRPAYMGALLILWSGDGMRSVDLARKVGLEPSTMTGLVDRMERDGWVVREKDLKDGRVKRVVPTKEAVKTWEDVSQGGRAVLDKAYRGIHQSEIETVKRVLERVRRNLEL